MLSWQFFEAVFRQVDNFQIGQFHHRHGKTRKQIPFQIQMLHYSSFLFFSYEKEDSRFEYFLKSVGRDSSWFPDKFILFTSGPANLITPIGNFLKPQFERFKIPVSLASIAARIKK